MEIGMLNFWLGLLVTALMKETYFIKKAYEKKNLDLNVNIAFQFQLIHSFFITANKTVRASDVHLLSFTHTFVLE